MTNIPSPKKELPSEDNQEKSSSSPNIPKWGFFLIIFLIILLIPAFLLLNHKDNEIKVIPLDKHGTYYDDKFVGFKADGQQERSLVVYSQIRNIQENNTWKKLEDANSLKDSGLRFITIEKDSRYDYKILNWNTSTLIFMPILTEERDLNRNVAIKENGIVIQHFNYKNLDERITVTINGDIIHSNFTVGDNSTTFKVTAVNSGTGAYLSGTRGSSDYNITSVSFCCGIRNDGINSRGHLNFTLSSIPLGSIINSVNLSIKIENDEFAGALQENYTIVSRNSTYTPPLNIGDGDAIAFDGYKSGSLIYGGVNTTIPMSTSQFNLTQGNWINFSFSSGGLDQISNLTGKDFRMMLFDELDIENKSTTGLAHGLTVGDDFTTAPVLFINYTSPLGNSAPTITYGVFLNSTDQLNTTFKNLTAVWIGNDVDINDIEKYNITWYSDNKSNFTLKNLAYTKNTLNVDILNSRNLTIGQTWKAMINICDNSSACVFTNTSELLIINSPPTIPNIIFPVNNLLTANFTINLSCSGSTDPEGNTPIKYEYYMQLETTPPTSSFGNTTGDTLNNTIGADGTYFWRCRAFDSLGFSSGFNDTRRFIADRRMVTENISTYIPTVLQGSLNHFSLNLTFNRTTTYDVNATFTYNTTLYNVTKTNYKDNGRLYDIDVSAPFSTATIPFSWNLTINLLNNTLNFNNSFTASQSLIGANISNCSTPNGNQALAVNFTLKDESNNTFVKSQFEATFNLWVNDQTVNTTIHFNQNDYSNATTVLLCISPPYATFKSEAEISYLSGGYQARQYYFRNITIDNQTDIIPLYLLSDLLSSPINFNILDNVGNGLSNYILNVLSHDIGNNTLTTIAMGKSDFSGNSLIYLKKNDPNYPYRFSVLDNIGRIVFTSLTDTFIIGDVTIRIAPSGNIIDLINALNNVQNSLTFSSGTSTYAYSYNDPSGKVATSTLKITRRTALADTVLITKTFTGSSGSFTYTLPSNDTGNYIATSIIGFNNENGAITSLPLKTISNEIVDTSNKLYTSLGRNGILATIFIIVTFAMLGITSSTLVIIFSLIGLLFMWFMGVINLGTLTVTLMVIVGGGILFYKLKN